MTNGEGRFDRAVAYPGWARVQSARGHETGRGLHGRLLAAVGVVLECLSEDLAALLELRTFLELPNNLAGLAIVPLNHLSKFFEHFLSGHPLVPIAFVK